MSRIPPIVRELIDRFDRNREAYKDPSYNEAQVRSEFIDPLFEALGWDVYNKQGYAEAYKDVNSPIWRQIDTRDQKTDQFVHELYGLTDEEIRIVEDATK